MIWRLKLVISIGLLGLVCLMVPGSLQADTVYSYTGNPMQCTYPPCNFTPALSISFQTTLAGTQLDNLNLATNGNISQSVTSFSFTMLGLNFSLTQTTPYISYNFEISTDSNGNIHAWNVGANNFGNPDADVHSYMYSWNESGGVFDQGSFQAGQVGSNLNDPGTWTVTSTPEPSTMALMLFGIGCVLLRASQYRRSMPARSSASGGSVPG